MLTVFRKKSWSSYVVGALIGILSCVLVYFLGRMLGASSAFERSAILIQYLFMPNLVEKSACFASKVTQGRLLEFQWMLVIGVALGSYISAFLSQSFQTERVPLLWKRSFGPSFNKRAVGAFLGGIIMIIGARIAGGCTSGKAISSGLQLGLSAWVFIATLFVSGIVTSVLLYRKRV